MGGGGKNCTSEFSAFGSQEKMQCFGSYLVEMSRVSSLCSECGIGNLWSIEVLGQIPSYLCSSSPPSVKKAPRTTSHTGHYNHTLEDFFQSTSLGELTSFS